MDWSPFFDVFRVGSCCPRMDSQRRLPFVRSIWSKTCRQSSSFLCAFLRVSDYCPLAARPASRMGFGAISNSIFQVLSQQKLTANFIPMTSIPSSPNFPSRHLSDKLRVFTFIGTIAVTLIHAGTPSSGPRWLYRVFLDSLTRCAVPYFFGSVPDEG